MSRIVNKKQYTINVKFSIVPTDDLVLLNTDAFFLKIIHSFWKDC